MRKAIQIGVCTIGLLCGALPAFAGNGLFGTIEFRAKSLAALPKWTTVLKKLEEEEADFSQCFEDSLTCTSGEMRTWRGRIRSLQGEDTLTMLQEVNKFANQWPYIEDITNYGISDYWATPEEFMPNSGDCEDYAIFKYVTLKRLGVNPDDMRLAVVKDTVRNIAHAVLVVKYADTFYVMDSLFDVVLPDSQVMQYLPYYSVNETTRWAHIVPREMGRK
ncbi:MAG: transglutaminase-like cysteine peptidase [Pseudomonadota bacterium]|nr:transglutaminase-like cysteine peptidase [Pseudomonadota bacterium]